MGEDSTEEYYDAVQHRTPSPVQICAPVLPIYKQGSSSLGARIAHCSSEYADPRQLYPNIPLPTELMHKTSVIRPDSVLSVSSNFTASSSEGEKTSGLGGSLETTNLFFVSTNKIAPCNIPNESVRGKADDVNLSDGSADSYYERSFEAIESFLENEMFRDSAVFSDHEELTDSPQTYSDCSILHGNDNVPPSRSTKNCKIPPPVPAKPDGLKSRPTIHIPGSKPGIFEKVKSLEQNCKYQKEDNIMHNLEGISKSILDRRRELELWKANGNSLSRDDECDTSSQHSTASTVIEVSPCKESKDCSEESEESGTTRGWVKHVIGKLQGSPIDELQQRDQC
jgi:hypothetical protein